jgi:AcrR family transcriptional regulator
MSRKMQILAIDERVLRTRNNIARAIVSLGAVKPIDSLKVGEICSAAGIARSTFYGHFPSLGHYLETSYANMVANCAVRGRDDPLGQGKVLAVHRILEHVHASRDYALSVEHSIHRPRMLAAGELRLQAIAERNLVKLMPAINSHERHTVATFIAGGFMSLLRNWTAGGLREPPDDIRQKFDAMSAGLIAGLGSHRLIDQKCAL